MVGTGNARSNGGRPVLATGACGTMRENKPLQGHDLVHFFEQDLLARAPGAEIESEVCLFHPVKAGNLRASIEVIGVGF